MDQETYDRLRQDIEAGRVAEIGGRTAATVDELDWLKVIGAKADGSTDVATTAATHTLTQEQLSAVIDAATASRDEHIAGLEDEAGDLNARIDGLKDALQRALDGSAAKDATVTALQAAVDTQRGQIETQKSQIETQKALNDAQQQQITAQQQQIGDLKSAAPAAQPPAADRPADKAGKQS